MALVVNNVNAITAQTSKVRTARDWQSIDLAITDDTTINLTGVTKVSYKETQDQKLNYGKGVYPVSKGYGNVMVEAEMTMYVWQLDEILENVSGFTLDTKRPQNINPFNIAITWTDRNPITGSKVPAVLKDTLYNCTIDTFEKTINQNDLDILVTVKLNPTGITWNEKA